MLCLVSGIICKLLDDLLSTSLVLDFVPTDVEVEDLSFATDTHANGSISRIHQAPLISLKGSHLLVIRLFVAGLLVVGSCGARLFVAGLLAVGLLVAGLLVVSLLVSRL